MKKLLLTLLAVALCVGVSVAQRRTATESKTIGTADGTMTYSYILRDGERIYDGPLTVKATQDVSDKIWMYDRYHWMYTERNYSLSANYSNDFLNGPIKMNDEISIRWSGESPEIKKTSFTGSFVRGIPNGRFLLDTKVTEKNGNKYSSVYVNVTYKMGVFTGAFSFKDFYYDEETYRNSPRCEITGSFTNSGKMNGKWYIYSSNNGYSYANTYQFVNGVLVGDDSSSLSAKETALATKYANGQITQKELNDNGLLAIKVRFDAYNYKNRDKANLYDDVSNCISTSIFYSLPEADNVLNSYEKVCHIPYFTDDSFETVFEKIQQDLQTKQNYQHIDSLLKKYSDSDLYCMEFCYWSKPYSCTVKEGWMYKEAGDEDKYWRYFLSDSQLKRVKDLVESHNLAIDKQKMAIYQPRINSNYINHEGAEITIERVGHDVVAVRLVKLDRNSGNMKVEIDTREYKQQADDNYILYSYEADYDGNTLSNLTPIRNKYSDIVDAKKAVEKEAEPTFTKINALINDFSILKGNLLEKQVAAFVTHYSNKVHNAKINHDNLDETLTSLKSQIPVIQNFNTLLPKYVEASKLNSQIVKQQIAKYTTTSMPQLTTWNTEAKSEEVDKVIEEQKQVLKLWETLAPLMEKVEKAHSALAASNDPILSGYKGLYTTALKKATLEEAITAYTNFIPAQEKALAQWNEYSALKDKGDKGHRTLAAANDPILADYYKTYNTVANTKESFEAGIAAYNNLIPKMENTLKLWEEFSTLRKQATRTHNAIRAANLPVMGEYTALYDTTVKGITSLDNGIAAYNKIIATQQNVTKYIGIYNEVVANHTTLPSTIKPAKCASKAYKVYYEGLNLNWKAEGAVEKITKIWTIQQSLAKVATRSTLKEDEKRVKKAKLTDIEEIIKSYLNGENVNVGEPKAEFIIKDIVEPKAETKTENKNAKTATKVEATPRVKTENKPHNQALATIQRGFGQYVEISPMFNSISSCNDSFSTHINYIAGYRFNKNLFLGVGTGVNLNFGHNTFFYGRGGGSWNYCDVYDASLAMFSIPVYLHFRVDFGKRAKLWNPYASISAGAQFGILEPYQHLADRFYNGSLPGSPVFHPLHMIDNELSNHTKRNKEGFVSLDFGANRRLTDKLSIYFGVGYKVGLRNDIRAMVEDSSSSIYIDTALSHSIKLNIGLSF